MSSATRKIMEAAIASHFADEHDTGEDGGIMLNDYVLTISGVNFNDTNPKTKYIYDILHNETIAPHTMVGLREIMLQNTVIPVVHYESENDYAEGDNPGY